MRSFSKLALVGHGLAITFLLTGCAQDNKPPESSLVPTAQGVACSKCQVTWVKVPQDNGKGRIIGYTTRKRDICPDCRDAVTNFFTTGKFQHTCKTCGDTMEICKAH